MNEIPKVIIEDIQWEAEQKAKGIKGWKLTQLFLERIYEESRRETGEGEHESGGDGQNVRTG